MLDIVLRVRYFNVVRCWNFSNDFEYFSSYCVILNFFCIREKKNYHFYWILWKLIFSIFQTWICLTFPFIASIDDSKTQNFLNTSTKGCCQSTAFTFESIKNGWVDELIIVLICFKNYQGNNIILLLIFKSFKIWIYLEPSNSN